MQDLHAGLAVIGCAVQPFGRGLVEHPRQRHVDRLEYAALHRQQMRREDEVARESAFAREGLTQLRQMAVRVPGGVGAIVLRNLAEQQIAFGIAAGARHT